MYDHVLNTIMSFCMFTKGTVVPKNRYVSFRDASQELNFSSTVIRIGDFDHSHAIIKRKFTHLLYIPVILTII